MYPAKHSVLQVGRPPTTNASDELLNASVGTPVVVVNSEPPAAVPPFLYTVSRPPARTKAKCAHVLMLTGIVV